MTHPYSTAEFAAGLSHIGEPLDVPEWGTMVLVRGCAGGHRDAVGTYPVSVFKPDPDLAGGLERLRALGLVSIVLVVEDLLRPDVPLLQAAFDQVREFKQHYLYDRTKPQNYSRHHRYEVRRARRAVRVERLDLADRLDEWMGLYDGLVRERGWSSTVHAFPRSHHVMLSRLSGAVAIGALADAELVSCHVWICHGGYAMSHLAASSDRGYALGASYAAYDGSIALLPDCRILNLGGVPGVADDRASGLGRFKRGFSNATARSYVCGTVLDVDAYEALSRQAGAAPDATYFPAYRQPSPVAV